MGQFFTPHEICRDMVGMLSPQPSEMILDMCCGMVISSIICRIGITPTDSTLIPMPLQWQDIYIPSRIYGNATYNSSCRKVCMMR